MPDGVLTERQRRFVEEYLIDLNATAAYKRAGYKPKSDHAAETSASRLLRNDEVRAEIRKQRKEQAKQSRITADRVLEELAHIAFSSLRDFGDWNAGGFFLKDSSQLPIGKARCVAEFSQTRTGRGGGSMRFKLHDKVKALDLLGEHLGLWGDVSEQEKFLNGLPPRMREEFLRALASETAADAALPFRDPEPSEADSAAAGVAPDEASP
jgi:phage terminase small subunit